MSRPVTLFTGQWADMPLETLAEKAASWGYHGLELACWGDHFDVAEAVNDDGYARRRRELLDKHGLDVWAVGQHLVGQAVCDHPDQRHEATVPERVWGDGDPEGVRERAAEELKRTARAADALGVDVVTGFTGSSIWHLLYSFPPNDPQMIEDGFRDFAERWTPILDVFDEVGVDFGLEVHPTEIAFDIASAERALDAIGGHERFGFNYDPSHFAYQGVDYVRFIERFADRIVHAHMKDVSWQDTPGRSGVFGGHLPFGDADRYWDFRSIGRGRVDFDAIIRALNRIGYDGPLSVEWEDPGMDREAGASESASYVKEIDFAPAGGIFDEAFAGDGQSEEVQA